MYDLQSVLRKLPAKNIPSEMDIYVGDLDLDTVTAIVNDVYGGAAFTVTAGSWEQVYLGRDDSQYATFTRTRH